MNIKPETQDLAEYLEENEIIDWKKPFILAKVNELTGNLTEEIEKAKTLFEWVRDQIPHSKDIGSDIVTCKASEVFKQETGICYAKSHLLAAMLRAVKIPTGFCYQVLCHDPPYMGHCLHGLNGIYLKDLNKWIRVDARGNTNGVDAQFGIDKEQLAFLMDPTKGEFIYDTIFASPAQVVVDTLKRFKSRDAMWPNLPSSL